MTAKPFVFVSVGTDPQPFDRLLREIDRLIEVGIIKELVFGQTGYSVYQMQRAQSVPFLDPIDFQEKIRQAEWLILHGGAGGIGLAMQYHKKCIVVPRLARFGEHANDHQLELVQALEKGGFILASYNINEIEKQIQKLPNWKPAGFSSAKTVLVILDEFVQKNNFKELKEF
ncbi:beta(1,3)galactosyltransferase EpsH [Candidatus Micrarchaeota archaeon]|nr:beta(1,3)galactosyltransferase EpsH [Candidatus Micrarchaeota archaeon]MBU1930211.1 beta(1,3)galactosyltransferase EpsH [Candidatus Micrarchaeota archaeon]